MKKSEKILSAILTMGVGMMLIVLKGNLIGVLMTVVGVCLIALGLMDFWGRLIPPATVKCIVGVFIIICGWTVIEAVLYIAAALLLIVGILLLYDKIRCSKIVDCWQDALCEYAVSILYILMGSLLLFHKNSAMNTILVIVGVLALVQGAILLFKIWREET